MLKIGWFSTGRDKAARDLLQAVIEGMRRGELPLEISFVFCNREPGESEKTDLFLKQVENYEIPLICLSSRKFKLSCGDAWREEFELRARSMLEAFSFDVGVLAGYMLIAGRALLELPLLNLHPAPPGGPAGAWEEVIWKLIEEGAERAGAMIHIATEELDRGPVVAYCTFSLREPPFAELRERGEKSSLFRLIRQHELVREIPLLTETLKALGEERVKIVGKKVFDAKGREISGLDLSPEVERRIRGIEIQKIDIL